MRGPRPGQLNDRVVLQVQRREADDQLGSQHLWDTYAERWADVKPLGGSERMVLGAVRADLTHVVWLRYDPDLVAEMRVIVGPATARRVLKSSSQPENVESRNIWSRMLCVDQGEYKE